MATSAAGTGAVPKSDQPQRESKQERHTRKWNEMLQELRVAQTGVQVLAGFLLTVPFSTRFSDLDSSTKIAYLATMCSAILAAGLLIAPVAFHRVLFGKREKEWLISAANVTARAGLVMMALTMVGVVYVVFDLVVGTVAAMTAGGVTVAAFLALWLVIPWVGAEVRDNSDSG